MTFVQHVPYAALLGRQALPNATPTLSRQCYKSSSSSSWFIRERRNKHTLLPHVMHQLWPYVCVKNI